MPGVIDSTNNFVEHPDLVAERLLKYASVVGAERVIAGSDCGFGTFAGCQQRRAERGLGQVQVDGRGGATSRATHGVFDGYQMSLRRLPDDLQPTRRPGAVDGSLDQRRPQNVPRLEPSRRHRTSRAQHLCCLEPSVRHPMSHGRARVERRLDAAVVVQPARLLRVREGSQMSDVQPIQRLDSARISQTSDIEQIRRLMAAYCQLLDGRQYMAFGQLFEPDGVWVLGGHEYRGPAAVEAFMDQLLLDHPHRRSCHMNANISIDLALEGDREGEDEDEGGGATAVATSDYVMFTRIDGGPWGTLAIGSYHDRFARRGEHGAWRFVERRLVR